MGNRYRAIFTAVLLFCGVALIAQESADGNDAPFFFPIHRLWQDAQGGAVRWKPDWPFAIPPDSFDPAANGDARRVTITVTAARDKPPETEDTENADAPSAECTATEYTARLDSDGRLVEFPFLLNGVFHQASARYDRRGAVETMTLAVSPEEPIEIVFLQIDGHTDEYRPVLARIKIGGAYYFASFRWEAGTCVELWTDETGIPLEIFRDNRIFHHDSMLNTTFISDVVSAVSARYNGSGVRYWTTGEKELAFQRDETGLIVRLTGGQKNVSDAGDVSVREPPVNYSYEYQFDQNGNWTERHEIRWFEIKDYLAPSSGTLVTRLIDYAPGSAR
jgi:hypothetical protein